MGTPPKCRLCGKRLGQCNHPRYLLRAVSPSAAGASPARQS
jgi:hypothetical protein